MAQRGSGLIINNRSVWGDDIKTVPYDKIKEIKFVKGLFWSSFTVKREGFWGSEDIIYSKKNITNIVIRSTINANAPGLVVIDKISMFGKIGGYLGKNQPTDFKHKYKPVTDPEILRQLEEGNEKLPLQ